MASSSGHSHFAGLILAIARRPICVPALIGCTTTSTARLSSDTAIEDLKRKLDELQNQLSDLSKKS